MESKLVLPERYKIGSVSISDRLMKIRKDIVAREKSLTRTQDLLALNFIFTRDFISEHFGDDIVDIIFKGSIPDVSDADASYVPRLASEAQRAANVGQFRKCVQDTSITDVSPPVPGVFERWTSTNALWSQSTHKKPNERTFQKQSVDPIFDSLFGDAGLTLAIDDYLTLPSKYKKETFKPDHYGSVSGMVGIVPVIMEVKKEDISGGIKAKDEIKLLSMIKLTLNVMMKANVKNPVVVGLLVQDNNIRVMSMEIKFEALYFPKEIGKVIIPLDQTDFTLFIHHSYVFDRRIVLETVKAVKECLQQNPELETGDWLKNDSEHELCRGSFYIRDHDDQEHQHHRPHYRQQQHHPRKKPHQHRQQQ
ncbi:hypothetical protein BGX31_003580, partial [Mortierella sp. GBA43]